MEVTLLCLNFKFKAVNKIECIDCVIGKKMCSHFPCFGTVADINLLIKKGYGDKLMLVCHGKEGKSTKLLCPAIKGFERTFFFPFAYEMAKMQNSTDCIFFEKNMCKIHDIKPTLGASCCCKRNEQDMQKESKYVLKTWKTAEGRRLVTHWKSLYIKS